MLGVGEPTAEGGTSRLLVSVRPFTDSSMTAEAYLADEIERRAARLAVQAEAHERLLRAKWREGKKEIEAAAAAACMGGGAAPGSAGRLKA